MRKRIADFYESSNLPKTLKISNIKRFEKYDDIAIEFEEWLCSKTFKSVDAVTVEGYTARKLSELFPYLNGDGAFILLIELREAPQKALKQIANGFKKK